MEEVQHRVLCCQIPPRLGETFFIFPLLTNAFHILKYLYYLRCTFFCCCIITRKVNKDQAFQYVCVVCYTKNPTRWIEKFLKIYIMRDFFLRSLKLIEISDMRGVRFLSNLKGIFCIKKILKYALNKDFRRSVGPTYKNGS